MESKEKELAKVRGPPQCIACKCAICLIVIAVGFPTSTSLTDALSINTGSGVNATTLGMACAFLDAYAPCRLSIAHATTPVEKGQGTVSFTFPDTLIDSWQLSSS